jgi:hypothetical protein
MTKFQDFYGNVRVRDAESVRNAVQSDCGISDQSFRNWAGGVFEPDSRWWSILNGVAERFGYDKIYVL